MATIQLGQFTDDHADEIALALDDAGISYYVKRFGRVVRLLSAADWGTRVFVEKADAIEAAEIARAIAPDGVNRRLRAPDV